MSSPEPNAPPELIPVTPEFVAAFKELLAAGDDAAAELGDMEKATFAKGEVMDRLRANELGGKRKRLIEAQASARKALQVEFDKYALQRNAATARTALRA